jgi:hypothetical protein
VPSWKTLEDLPAGNVLIPVMAEEQSLPVRRSVPVSPIGHN